MMKKRVRSILLCLVLCCSLLPVTALAESVNDVYITVDIPAGGQTPADVPPDITTANPRIYAWDWKYDGSVMSKNLDAFEKGKTYELVVIITGTGEFTQHTRVRVNNEIVRWEPMGDYMIRVSKEFTLMDEILDDLNVILPPATPGERISTVANEGVVEGTDGAIIQAIFWYLNGEEQSVKSLFLPDTVYDAHIRLYAQDGYRFSDPLRVTVNGETPSKITSNGALASFEMKITSTSELQTAGAIIVSVNAPKAGEKPSSYAGHTGGGGFYTKKTSGLSWDYFRDGVSWYDETTQTPLSYNDAFETDHSYSVTISYQLQTGYQWPADSVHRINGDVPTSVKKQDEELTLRYVFSANTAPKVLSSISITTPPSKTEYVIGDTFDPTGMVITATYSDNSTAPVGGYTVTPDKLSAGATSVTISYTQGDVTKTATQAVKVDDSTIGSVALTLAAPKAGEKASFTASIPSDANYTVKTVDWFCDEDNASLKDGDVYGKKTYILNVTLSPKSGCKFADETVLKGTLNGESAQARRLDDGSALVTKYFPLGNSNPFTDVKENDYFYDAVLWAYYAEPQVTNGVSETEFGPKSTVTRGQAMTFLWRAKGCPEPKATRNPFADIQESEYWYKAILWAVENGVTLGTDDTHFSPTQTCSTAHIITFLYRAMGIGADGWYAAAQAWAKGAGLLDGIDLAVSPGVNCPRADVVLYLYRAIVSDPPPGVPG